MLASDLTTCNMAFLKDYWRADVKGMQTQEDAICTIHESKKVENIALYGMDNDTRVHKAVKHRQLSAAEAWAVPTNGIKRRFYYRMTLKFVGQSLTGFESSREFISAIADAMEAHDNAYFDAQILHHDISVGNILFTDNKKGVLIDWDVCANSHSDAAVARRPSRMGTWLFMSAIRLKCPDRAHQLEDDRESAFHLLLWLALRYTESKLYSPDALNADLTISDPDATPSNGAVSLMPGFDETEAYGDGVVRGGLSKKLWFICNDLTGLKFSGRPALDALVSALIDSLAVRYERPPKPDDIEALQVAETMIAEDPGSSIADVMRRSLTGLLAYRHPIRMARLTAQGWLVDTLRKHLDTADLNWPRDSATLQQLVPGPESGPRRRIKFYQPPEERTAANYIGRWYI